MQKLNDEDTALTVLPQDEVVTNTEQCTSDETSCNTFNLNLRTSALSVQLQTKTAHSPIIAELSVRLECALEQARELEDRLSKAFYRIGYLESQLIEREKLIAELKGSKM